MSLTADIKHASQVLSSNSYFQKMSRIYHIETGIQPTLGNWRWRTKGTHTTKLRRRKDARKAPDNVPHTLSPRRQLSTKWPHSSASPVTVCNFFHFCSGFCKYLSCIKCLYFNVGKLEVKIKFIPKFQCSAVFSERTKTYDSYCS